MAKAKTDPVFESNTGTGPVEVTTGGKGTIDVSQRDSSQELVKLAADDEVRFDLQDLWIGGHGFQERVEVVFNFDALDGNDMNNRVSSWTEDGNVRPFQVPMFVRPGKYRITAYVPQERVGGDPNDHTREMKMVDQKTVTIAPVPV